MYKFLTALVLSFVLSSASAQTYVMRVHDRIYNMVTYERYVRNGNRTLAVDHATNQVLFSVEERFGGRRVEIRSPSGEFTAWSETAPKNLRPGEETFGTMVFALPNGKLVNLNLHAKAFVVGGLNVVEMTSSAPGLVIIGRVGYRNHYHDPEWGENVMLFDGKKLVDDRLTRVR